MPCFYFYQKIKRLSYSLGCVLLFCDERINKLWLSVAEMSVFVCHQEIHRQLIGAYAHIHLLINQR